MSGLLLSVVTGAFTQFDAPPSSSADSLKWANYYSSGAADSLTGYPADIRSAAARDRSTPLPAGKG